VDCIHKCICNTGISIRSCFEQLVYTLDSNEWSRKNTFEDRWRNLQNILHASMNLGVAINFVTTTTTTTRLRRFVDRASDAYLLFFQLAPRADSVPQTTRTKRVCGLSRLNTRRLSASRYARGVFTAVNDDAIFSAEYQWHLAVFESAHSRLLTLSSLKNSFSRDWKFSR